MNQGNHEQSTAWRQSKALLGIRESVKNYASLYNHYIRVDRWDKAFPMMQMIDNLVHAIPFIDESLRLNVILDSDGDMIKEINISNYDGDVIGLPWFNGVVGRYTVTDAEICWCMAEEQIKEKIDDK